MKLFTLALKYNWLQDIVFEESLRDRERWSSLKIFQPFVSYFTSFLILLLIRIPNFTHIVDHTFYVGSVTDQIKSDENFILNFQVLGLNVIFYKRLLKMHTLWLLLTVHE